MCRMRQVIRKTDRPVASVCMLQKRVQVRMSTIDNACREKILTLPAAAAAAAAAAAQQQTCSQLPSPPFRVDSAHQEIGHELQGAYAVTWIQAAIVRTSAQCLPCGHQSKRHDSAHHSHNKAGAHEQVSLVKDFPLHLPDSTEGFAPAAHYHADDVIAPFIAKCSIHTSSAAVQT